MSENDTNLLMTVMNKGFDRIDGAIMESRKERHGQVASLHCRLNEHGERIRALEVAHAENMNKCNSPKVNFFGNIETPRWKANGFAAVIIAAAIAVVIYSVKSLV